MLIKKIMLINFLCISMFNVMCQELIVRPEIGLGSFAMSDLRGIQNQSVEQSLIQLKSTDKFPPYFFYNLDLLFYPTKMVGVGFVCGYTSTGCRNHYADYSGSYSEDVMVNATSLGGIISFRSEISYNLFFSVELSTGIKYSKIDIDNELILEDFVEANDYILRSQGWFLEPKLRLERSFLNSFFIGAFIGYEYNHKSKMQSTDSAKWYLNYNGKKATIDWSGARIGLSVYFSTKQLFFKKIN